MTTQTQNPWEHYNWLSAEQLAGEAERLAEAQRTNHAERARLNKELTEIQSAQFVITALIRERSHE